VIDEPLLGPRPGVGESVVAVIADIVGSRRHHDRHGAQQILDAAIDRVTADSGLALQPFRPTVGDEQQAVYPTIASALTSILLLRLILPNEVDCRFGVGIGAVTRIPTRDVSIPDGPAWWAARAAIDRVHALQDRTIPRARTWVVAHESANEVTADAVRWANAYLLARDELVAAMSDRTRRLVYGRFLSRTQADLARSEGITQSAVSQALSSAGASSLLEGLQMFELT